MRALVAGLMADNNKGTELYSYNWWINQLNKDEKRLGDNWWKKADKIVNKFKGKRDLENDDTFILNIFWANTEVMKAALYGKKPKPVVKPIWQDSNDDVARVAAMMMERCLNYDLIKNKSPMDAAIKLAVEDWLIPGLGMIWFRYESDIETKNVADTSINYDVVNEERVCCDYVHWRDLIFPSARTADEVWYLGRKIYMTRADISARFKVNLPGDEGENAVRDPDNILPKNFAEDKVCLYELWCRKNRKIYWVCKEIPNFCQSKDDFLDLEDFYPAPMPLLATHTTDDYLPRPDYTMMRDQYDKLNELNTRITILESALRVVGVYDKKNAEVSRVLGEARENDMIAVDKWAVLAEAGGLKGVVDWFPVDMVAEVLDKLRELKLDKKQEIYELSGISDIMRGASNPRETLGAQKLKAQFGSVRLEYRQDAIAQFVKNALAIKAEIICKHCQPQTIMAWSNIQATPDAQYAEQAVQLLKNDFLLQHKVDINEQILSLPDYQQEQENRMEFLTTVGQFLSQSAQMVESAPGAMPHLIKMISWAAGSFKGANEIQGVLEQALAAAAQQGGGGQQGPDVVGAEQVKQQGEMAKVQATHNAKMEQIKLDKDLELRNLLEVQQLKATGTVHEVLGEQILGMQEHQQEMQQQQQAAAHDQQAAAQEHQQGMQAADQQHAHGMEQQQVEQVAAQQQQAQEHQHQDATMQSQAAMDEEANESAHEREVEMAGVQHKNSLEQGKQSGNVQLEVSKMRAKGGNTPKNK